VAAQPHEVAEQRTKAGAQQRQQNADEEHGAVESKQPAEEHQ
jgi:hypothetical protein